MHRIHFTCFLKVLKIKMVRLNINTCDTKLIFLFVYCNHHSFPKCLSFHIQMNAWSNNFSDISSKYAMLYFVLLIIHLIEHENRNSSFKKLDLCKFNLFRPEIDHQKNRKFFEWLFKDFMEFNGIIFKSKKLYFPNLSEDNTIHIFGFMFPINSKHRAHFLKFFISDI